MTILERFDDLAAETEALHLAIGVFDGVHTGHQAVLRAAVGAAREGAGCSLMITFDPHPVSVLRPNAAPRLLTSLKQKLHLAAALGVDKALVAPFTRDFSLTPGPHFVEALVSSGAPIRSVSVGRDWRFGRGRSGDLAALRQLGAVHGFEVNGVAPLHIDGRVVSSTLIRSLIGAGGLDEAARYLGRPFSLQGTVETGARLGRTLGFPTANLACGDCQLPPPGVYAGHAFLAQAAWGAVANLGSRPTVSAAPEVRLEVHLLDYQGPEFYGEELEFAFLRHLRGETKFASVTELASQIREDVRLAREMLTIRPVPTLRQPGLNVSPGATVQPAPTPRAAADPG